MYDEINREEISLNQLREMRDEYGSTVGDEDLENLFNFTGKKSRNNLLLSLLNNEEEHWDNLRRRAKSVKGGKRKKRNYTRTQKTRTVKK